MSLGNTMKAFVARQSEEVGSSRIQGQIMQGFAGHDNDFEFCSDDNKKQLEGFDDEDNMI